METPNSQALPMGYQLQDYEIRKVLSAGSFSFVYIAHDKDKRTVAMPGLHHDHHEPGLSSANHANNQGDENTRTAKDLTDDEIEKAIAEIQAAINEAQIYTVFT